MAVTPGHLLNNETLYEIFWEDFIKYLKNHSNFPEKLCFTVIS